MIDVIVGWIRGRARAAVRTVMRMRGWGVALALVVVGLGAGACVDNASQAKGARGYNERTDLPPKNVGPAGNNASATPRNMVGNGRGSAAPRGK